jgi:serine/threonine protein kinase
LNLVPGPDPTSSIRAGRTLGGRYRLVAPVARGGMAEVWEGHDEVLSRPVAVKVLQAHLATDGVFLERFRREAVTAARLAHPCVVSTYDTGIDEGTAYIVMELVRGDTLRHLLSEHGRLDTWLAVTIARQIADALAEAHAAGLVHRDIKPANVLLLDDGWGGVRVKVTDFGIAKASEGIGADLTRTGTVLGTPKYLSPEQIRGEEPDSRADLYSLGVVLFEMIAGDPPYSGSTDMATALAHLNDRIPKLSSRVRGVPPPLERLVNDLLAKDPERRVPSAQALRARLDALGPLSSGKGGSPPPLPTLPAASSRARVDQAASRAAVGTVAENARHHAEETSVLGGTMTIPTNGSGSSVTASPGTSSTPRELPGGIPTVTGGGPPTDPFGTGESPPPSRRSHQAGRRVGIVVASLVAVGAITAAAVLSGSARHRTHAPAGATQPPSASPRVDNVVVYMTTDRPPDNPSKTRYTFDGDPSTVWPTDQYSSPTFGNLYPGIGLAIQLDSSEQGRQLVVTSPGSGWAAQTYVASADVPSGRPVTDWGAATDSKSDIASGTVTFNLGSRRGQWVLLWITNLGPTDEARVAEVSLR